MTTVKTKFYNLTSSYCDFMKLPKYESCLAELIKIVNITFCNLADRHFLSLISNIIRLN